MRLKRAPLVLLLIVLSALCGATFTVKGQESESGTVWFYRVEEAPRTLGGTPKLRINEVEAAKFPEREFIGVKFKPGKYVFRLHDKRSSLALEIEPGETYFVQVSHSLTGTSQIDRLILQPETQALFHFEDVRRPLEDKNIFDKSLIVIREKPSNDSQ